MMSDSYILLLSVAVVLLVVIVALLVWHHISQDKEIRRKNDVIVREVRRNLELRQRASSIL